MQTYPGTKAVRWYILFIFIGTVSLIMSFVCVYAVATFNNSSVVYENDCHIVNVTDISKSFKYGTAPAKQCRLEVVLRHFINACNSTISTIAVVENEYSTEDSLTCADHAKIDYKNYVTNNQTINCYLSYDDCAIYLEYPGSLSYNFLYVGISLFALLSCFMCCLSYTKYDSVQTAIRNRNYEEL